MWAGGDVTHHPIRAHKHVGVSLKLHYVVQNHLSDPLGLQISQTYLH